MTERLLPRAASGDETAFRELTDPFRRELQLHCYRILGRMRGISGATLAADARDRGVTAR